MPEGSRLLVLAERDCQWRVSGAPPCSDGKQRASTAFIGA